MMERRLSKFLITILLTSTIWSCKAQSVATFTSFSMEQSNSFDYVQWFNSNVKSTSKVDTVSLLTVPNGSDLAYIHIRPTKGVVTIKMSGAREYKIDENRIWLVTALFDNNGNMISPIEPFEASGYDFEVRADRCRSCNKMEINKDL